MVSNSAFIGSVLVIGIYYVCYSSLLTNVQVPKRPEIDLTKGRVQGIFDQCNKHGSLNNISTENKLQDAPKCTGTSPNDWNVILCSKRLSAENELVKTLISTTLQSGGEYCGDSITQSLVCQISSNLFRNNIEGIEKFVTNEVFNKLKIKFGNKLNKNINLWKYTNADTCLSLLIQIEEQEHGHYLLKSLEFVNQNSKEEYIETQRKLLILNVINKIFNGLQENMIQAKIYWRIKSPGSIRMKMQLRNLTMDKLNDIIGIRFIVNKDQECYRVLDIIHNCFEYKQADYKDYIKNPKASGYQSLHTVIDGEKSELGKKFNTKIEIQIRTWQMHYVAEHGQAAHSIYKKNQTDLVSNIG